MDYSTYEYPWATTVTSTGHTYSVTLTESFEKLDYYVAPMPSTLSFS